PKKSIFSKTGTFVSFKEIYPINNKIMPIGTLIKNNQCHVPVKSIIKLPKPGPITEAIPCIPPIIPSMLPCFFFVYRSEEHTSELQSRFDLVCRLLLEKKKKQHQK